MKDIVLLRQNVVLLRKAHRMFSLVSRAHAIPVSERQSVGPQAVKIHLALAPGAVTAFELRIMKY